MRKKIFFWLRHSLFLLFFLGLPFLLFLELFKLGRPNLLHSTFLSPFYWIFCLSFPILFYLNYYIIVPKLWFKKKYGQYILIVFLLFLCFYFLKPFELMFRYYFVESGKEVKPLNIWGIDLFTCIFFMILITSGMMVQVMKQFFAIEKRALQAEAEKANAELSFLKAQINPHFLFNTLNNIYSLAVDQQPEAPDSILKLSNIMRYITDEATHDFVPLEKEIACLSDFIALQRLRHGINIKLDYEITGNIVGKKIAPLILMTYIENAFKYGISSHEEALITIKIFADENQIKFFCQNKIFETPRVTERTGIGLINTTRRLKHMYLNKHKLTITSENGFYTVELTLEA